LTEIDATFVSVDVETAGPNPSDYSLLSIGACLVADLSRVFYVEIQPVCRRTTSEAMAIHGLSLDRLTSEGQPPPEAMRLFAGWLDEAIPDGRSPVFVGFNAAFDWMFVNDYFHRFFGRNPFGYAAFDIKSYYMGLAGVSWDETAKRRLASRFPGIESLTHNALQDAIDQAKLLRQMQAAQPGQPPRHLDDRSPGALTGVA
jgi:ribonuclease T